MHKIGRRGMQISGGGPAKGRLKLDFLMGWAPKTPLVRVALEEVSMSTQKGGPTIPTGVQCLVYVSVINEGLLKAHLMVDDRQRIVLQHHDGRMFRLAH